ncbi:MAG: barstar family protein [Gemmatimonadetes bacterium]|nr:barstar family protein [Gemmatimonadota bacterium]
MFARRGPRLPLHPDDLKMVSWVCIHFFSEGETAALLDALGRTELHIVEMDTTAVFDERAFFDLFSSAFDLAASFGMNWNAVIEVLSDLDKPGAKGYLLIVRSADTFWRRLPQVSARLLSSVLAAAEEKASTGIPFHVIFVW